MDFSLVKPDVFCFLHYYRNVLHDLLVWCYFTYVSFRFCLIELYYMSSRKHVVIFEHSSICFLLTLFSLDDFLHLKIKIFVIKSKV